MKSPADVFTHLDVALEQFEKLDPRDHDPNYAKKVQYVQLTLLTSIASSLEQLVQKHQRPNLRDMANELHRLGLIREASELHDFARKLETL